MTITYYSRAGAHLLTDADHGNRGAGLHPLASPSTNGVGGSVGEMSATDKENINDVSSTTPTVVTSGSPTLVASKGGKETILAGTASAPILPAAASNLGKSCIVTKFNLAADVVIGRTGSDVIAGGDTGAAATQYTLSGSNSSASFLAVQDANLNSGNAFWKAYPAIA
jgi:hypothetical protein